MTNQFSHDKNYRPIRKDDLQSARRALDLDSKSDDALLDLRARHEDINAFASGVIAQAAEEILIERGVL